MDVMYESLQENAVFYGEFEKNDGNTESWVLSATYKVVHLMP